MKITEHRHIVKDPGICSGSAAIAGTRIPVKAIVVHYQSGMPLEDILEGFPLITPAQFFDALSYYHDHKHEIEQDIAADSLEKIMAEFSISACDDSGKLHFT